MHPTRLRRAIETTLGVPLVRGLTGDRFGWSAGGRFMGATLEAVAATIAQGGGR